MRRGLATPRYWWVQPKILGIDGGYNSNPEYITLFHGEGIRILKNFDLIINVFKQVELPADTAPLVNTVGTTSRHSPPGEHSWN